MSQLGDHQLLRDFPSMQVSQFFLLLHPRSSTEVVQPKHFPITPSSTGNLTEINSTGFCKFEGRCGQKKMNLSSIRFYGSLHLN